MLSHAVWELHNMLPHKWHIAQSRSGLYVPTVKDIMQGSVVGLLYIVNMQMTLIFSYRPILM